jgi:GH25 family lysozyme M1 (1,4-beta-N-acetylmuramidase)
MLYGSKNYLESVWRPNGYPVWVAQYADSTDYSGDYIMWQKGSTGHLSGIETYVDLDVLYKDKYTFTKYPK